MMKRLLPLFFLFASVFVMAQNVGDTIRVEGFNFHSATRDSVIHFPDVPGQTFEKILLKYTMRCRNASVLTGADDGVTGCGQWDYSCNTFVADSAKIENELLHWPDFLVSNFSGTVFPYTTQQTFGHYEFTQHQVALNNIVSETSATLGSNSQPMATLLRTSLKSGRSQILLTAAQLLSAGFAAGEIDGIGLNVTNAGGEVQFLRIRIKPTSLIALSAQDLDFTGFTDVYFSDHTFVPGNNRLQFFTPFTWDGTSSLILEFSFSDPASMPDIGIAGFPAAVLSSLSASNIASVDTSGQGEVSLDPQYFGSIGDQLSIAFWAYGNPEQPSDCSILYGYSDNISQRELNLHLPWGGEIYFDCGYVDGGYDRIEQNYGADSVIKGQWNHWVFTKNATTGVMNIYLNGSLWLTGSNKNRQTQLLHLILGKFTDGSTNKYFKGKIRELSVWDTELAPSEITAWKNKSLDASHPEYAHLLAYYKLDEMSGQSVHDSRHGLDSTGSNLNWDFERGDQLTTTFEESALLPQITFYRGTYDQTVTPVVRTYDHPLPPHVVGHYAVVSHQGETPMADDALQLLSTQYLFEATPENIYDESGAVTGTIPVAAEGTIDVTQLDYYRRYPFYNELVSFVTPYGIGLDLGPSGKSWYFDMTDYAPLLKGDKRIVMGMGGQWQEEIGLEFQFIVGTPPRNVVQFEQLWQGAYRIGDEPIASINAGTSFPTNNFHFADDAVSFKLKSTITGHGSQGEFSQNGGTVHHRIYANNVQKFDWTITQDCSENPIFPQGGTWVYNRQGWCPGQRSFVKEQDMGSFASPGATVALNYKTSNPSVPSGDYRYITAHQVIGYAAPNFATDASIEVVKAPNGLNAEYGRINPMCTQPQLIVRNTGSNAISSITFDYWLNDADVHQQYTWNGALASMNATNILLPVQNLWITGTAASGNTFHASITAVNGAADDYAHNNNIESSFQLPEVLPETFKIVVKTNNVPTQNSYILYDDAGNVVDSKNFFTANTVYTYTYTAPQLTPGCYHLRVEDSGNDGLSWWANTAQGTGYMRILSASDAIIKTFQPDFGGGFDYSFSVNSLLGTPQAVADTGIHVYPNPSAGQFVVRGEKLIGAHITVTDLTGKTIAQAVADDVLQIFDLHVSAGIYFVRIENAGSVQTQKLIIE